MTVPPLLPASSAVEAISGQSADSPAPTSSSATQNKIGMVTPAVSKIPITQTVHRKDTSARTVYRVPTSPAQTIRPTVTTVQIAAVPSEASKEE